ncbi:hypothetical protein UlMin_039744 [Ulmus minor]
MATINTANTNLAGAAAVKSPRNAGDGVGSPQSRRATGPRASPWTQIVRGESEPIAAVPSSPPGSGSASAAVVESVVAAGSSSSSSPPPSVSTSPPLGEEMGGESSDNGSGTNGNAGKRPAWNKPSNGGVEIGPVMGAVSWPALSESTRVPSKSASEPLKGLSDGSSSVPLSQGSGIAVPTTTPTQKHSTPTLTPNHTGASPSPSPSPSPRPRTMRRNNSNTSSNGGLSQQQAPASQVIEMAPNTPSPRDNTQRSGFGLQSHNSGDHPPHRNSFRRNNGPHPRGDGSHHHNYGGRRDHDRGNQDWNSHRNFNGRDTHMQSPRVGSRVYRPTPQHSTAPFIPTHVVRPYGPIGYPDMGPPMFYIPSTPFVAPMSSPFYVAAPPDPQLSAKIVNQIEYYFSNDNLIKDTYLRKNMDDQGWVSIELIANFKKVKDLTEHIPLIVEALRMSSVLELQGEKVRKRNDWMRWPLTPGNSSQDMLAARVHGIALEENNTTPQSGNQPQMPNGDGTSQYSVQAGSDRSFAGRN